LKIPSAKNGLWSQNPEELANVIALKVEIKAESWREKG
jgi:hypothetical protein